MTDTDSFSAELELQLANFKLDVLQEIISVMPGAGDQWETLDFMMNRIFSLVEMEGASIITLNDAGDKLVFRTVRGEKEPELTGLEIDVDRGIAGKVMSSGKPILLDDTNKDDDFYKDVDKEYDYVTSSLIAVPIMAGEKKLGVLEGVNLDVDEINSPGQLMGLFECFADLIAIILENGLRIKELDGSVRYANRLLDVSHAINSALDIEDVLNVVMSCAKEMLDSEAASLFLVDNEKENLYIYVARGEKKSLVEKETILAESGIAGAVASSGNPLIVNDAYADERFDRSMDKKTGFKTRSILCVPMYKAGTLIGVIEVINKNNNEDFDERDLILLQTIANESAVAVKSSLLQVEKGDLFEGALKALAQTVNMKDEYDQGHSERVAYYATQIGKSYRPDDSVLHETLHVAGMIHDVGKIGIPDSILLKSGKLNKAEMMIIETHSEMSHKIATSIGDSKGWLNGILHHHERYDGSGYPDKLKGKDVPLIARVLSVADAYDAMTTDRPYRAKMTPEDAAKIVSENAGSQFDPDVVDAFSFAFEGGLLEYDTENE